MTGREFCAIRGFVYLEWAELPFKKRLLFANFIKIQYFFRDFRFLMLYNLSKRNYKKVICYLSFFGKCEKSRSVEKY